jgi:general secretion pathway protein N
MTQLLAAVCAWALLLLVLVVAGLGNQFPKPVEVTAAAPAMPAVTEMKERLGPLTDYLEIGNRPLLMPDRRPGVVLADGGQGGATDLDVSLTSVLMTPTLQMVILTGNQDGRSLRVRLGDTAEGSNWRLIRLEPRRATFERPSGEVTLELRVFDGRTATAAQPGTAGAPPPQAEGSEPAKPPEAPVATPVPPPLAPASLQSPQTATQAQQIEAIRRRIEARRAQMRAAAAANDNADNH